MRVTLSELKVLIRKLVVEYVANDSPQNANKKAHPDPQGSSWDKGLDESEEDHTDTHGATKHPDPRWDEHGDPTGKSWDAGLD